MGMMMLNTKHRDILLKRPPGCHVSRVQVMNQKLRGCLKKMLQMGCNVLKMAVCLKVFHVTDMLAYQGVSALQKCNGVFKLPPCTKNNRPILPEKNRCWHIPPASPDVAERSGKMNRHISERSACHA